MKVLDIYIILENVGKKYDISPDILRYILNYEKLNIMRRINNDFIHRKIAKSMDNRFTFHISNLPYASLDSVYMVNKYIMSKMKIQRPDLIFSHFCCQSMLNDPKGVMYVSHDDNKKKIKKPIKGNKIPSEYI